MHFVSQLSAEFLAIYTAINNQQYVTLNCDTCSPVVGLAAQEKHLQHSPIVTWGGKPNAAVQVKQVTSFGAFTIDFRIRYLRFSVWRRRRFRSCEPDLASAHLRRPSSISRLHNIMFLVTCTFIDECVDLKCYDASAKLWYKILLH